MLELQAMVAVPDPVRLVGVIVPQVRPEGTVRVRATVPANPLSDVTVIVAVALDPALLVIGLVMATV